MHILIGAAVGAVFAAGMVAGVSLMRGRRPRLRDVLLAAAGGAVAGAVTSATLGAGGVAGASIARQAVSFAAGGAAGGVTDRVGSNALEGRPLQEGAGRAAAFGAGAGLISLGTSHGTRAVLNRAIPSLRSPETATGWRRLLAAPTPATGRGRALISLGSGSGLLSGGGSEPGQPRAPPASAGGPDEPAPRPPAPPSRPARAPTPGMTDALGF